ncbi:MAG: CAP domain-containing protein [Microgenomates group bacterium]
MKLLEWLKDLFIPHSGNNHKAKILHPASLSIIVALFLTGQFFLNFFSLTSPSVLGYASNITPEQIIQLTNQKRAELGLNPLVNNPLLNEVAQRKAADMFAFNYWAHVSPSGRDPWSFFKEVGYRYIYAGENLARDFMDSSSVVEAWMNSPTHRDNIVNPNFKEIGVAVVNGTLNGIETTLVVQVFGTPPPAPVVEKKPSLVVKNQTQEQKTKTEIKQETKPEVKSPEETLPSEQLPPEETKPLEEKVPYQSVVLARGGNEVPSPPLFSPFLFTKTIALFLLGIILGALIIDGILVAQNKVVRLSGKNLAHLLFIATLLLAIIFTTPGAIL